jgi:two-component system chemotaxis sensor kinase CheA
MDTMAAIKQTFFQECDEQLAELEQGLLAIERGEGDLETINAVFRAVHSIKGGAGAFGLDDLVRFAHTFETTLDGMRAGTLDAAPPVVRLMLRSADILADLVHIARDGGEIDAARVAQMSEELVRASGAEPDPAATEPPAFEPLPAEDGPEIDEFGFAPVQFSFEALDADDGAAGSVRVRFAPRPELYAKANDALRLLRELGRLGDADVACDISTVPLLTELDPEGAYLSWDIALRGEVEESAVREIFEFVEFDCDLSIETGIAGPVMDEADAARSVQEILAQIAAEAAVEPSAPAAVSAPAPARPAPVMPAPANTQQAPQQLAQHQGRDRKSVV